MKRTSRCPKCDHGEVLFVPELHDSDSNQLGLARASSLWANGVQGALEAYVCLACGFVELHVASLTLLEPDKIEGAIVQRADPRPDPPPPPYR